MKASIDKAQIGLVLAISLIGGGAYKYSAMNSQVEYSAAAISVINSKFDRVLEKLDEALKMKTDIEVIKTKVELINKSGNNTQANVRGLIHPIKVIKDQTSGADVASTLNRDRFGSVN